MVKGFNLVLFTFLVLSGIGVGWLSLHDIEAGNIYTTILVVPSVLLLLSFLFRGDSKIGDLLRSPLTVDYDIAIGMYFTGLSLPVIINSILGLFNIKFSVAQAMIPLATTTINNELLQSFSAVETSLDPFWQMFITVFTAGTIEEYAWGYAFMVIFFMVGMFVLKMLNGGNDMKYMKAKTFYMVFALAGSILTFGGTHALNGTYVGGMFLIAMIFRGLMNSAIYLGGMFLSFTMGYHHSNNFIFFMDSVGLPTTMNALFGVKGLLIVALYLLMLTYLIRNWGNIWRKTTDAILGRS